MSQLAYIFVGAKGGAGTTMLVHEMAARLSLGGRAWIVDGDLTGRRSHAVSFDLAAALDTERDRGMPAMATARNTQLIELTRTYEDGYTVCASDVETLRARAGDDALFLVDAPQPFAAAMRPFMVRAAAFVVVTEPTLLGVAAARSMMLSLGRFGVSREGMLVVLNDARVAQKIARDDIAAALGHGIACEIPNRRERTFTKALEQLGRSLSALRDVPPLTLKESGSLGVGDRRAAARRLTVVEPGRQEAHSETYSVHSSDVEHMKAELHAEIMSRVDFMAAARAYSDKQKMAELRSQVDDIAGAVMAERGGVGSAETTAAVRREIVEEALGLGPIESLLHDDEITEVMVNGYTNIYIERRGRIEKTPKRFADDRQLRLVIERILAPLGRRIDESSPMVDARLPDGSRVNAIIEPLSIDGPTLTIRRFGTRRLAMHDLIRMGSINESYADFLRAAVEARLNLVVSGGTGSGKTTLLNALSAYIPRNERIVTIEDAAELLLDQPHVVRLESRPPNLEGAGSVPIRELVRNALRMRPDRIVVGECRSGEALDMLQAMNTGHDGSLTTAHANSPRDAISRIETMVLMAGLDLPLRAVREQIAGGIDIIVQVERFSDGTRRVVSISEVVGMEGDIVTMQELARFRQRGIDAKGVVQGAFEPGAVQPACLARFEEMGVEFDITQLSGPAAEAMAWARR